MPHHPPQTWEVGLLELPIHVPGVARPGLLYVIEQGTAVVRMSQPLHDAESIGQALRKAIDAPRRGAPGVPARILVSDDDLAAQVRAALGERAVPVDVAASLPAFDALVRSFEEEAGGEDEDDEDEYDDDEDALFGPGMGSVLNRITADQPRWAAALQRLWSLAPWRTLGGSHRFGFSGHPRLDVAVATVTDDPPGVYLFDDEDERASFVDGLESSYTSVEIVAADMFDADSEYLQHARASGLELTGGRIPQVFSAMYGDPRHLDDDEQRVVLAALQAVVALCAAHPDLAAGPREITAQTVVGPVTVTCASEGDEE